MYVWLILCCTAETNTICKATIFQLNIYIYTHLSFHLGAAPNCFPFFINKVISTLILGFPSGLMVKNTPANEGAAGDLGLMSWGYSLEGEMETHSTILAWRIPWTEEAGGSQSVGLQKLDTTEWLNMHTPHQS